MSLEERRQQLLWVAALGGAVLVGVGLAVNQDAGFALAVVALAALTVIAPASAYVLLALVAALTFKGLATLELLPPIAIFLDLPIAWAAFGLALVKRRNWSPRAALFIRWVAAFGLVTLVSWLFHPSDVVRPFLYVALLCEPFAILGAMLIDPPSRHMWRILAGTALALVLVQIPIMYYQSLGAINADHIQGTLLGAGAGAHSISAVIVIGAIWILSGLPRGAAWRLSVVALILPLAVLADAKQVLFALPAAVLVGRGGQSKTVFALRGIAVVGSLGALLLLVPAGRTAVSFIDRTVTQQGGKIETFGLVVQELSQDPASLVLGKGPAQTVSRAAFMTTDALLAEESPLRAFDLEPATFPDVVQVELGPGGTSFASGVSSALGVLGDLGILGAMVFAAMYATAFLMARSTGTPEGVGAAAGWAMLAVLGLVFDWWEQPPVTVFVGVLTGLAVTKQRALRRAPAEPAHAAALR